MNVGPRMSQGVVHGNTVYLAGQVAQNAAGRPVAEQTKDILAAIDRLLAEAGTSKERRWRNAPALSAHRSSDRAHAGIQAAAKTSSAPHRQGAPARWRWSQPHDQPVETNAPARTGAAAAMTATSSQVLLGAAVDSDKGFGL